jgi:hypothetical protein
MLLAGTLDGPAQPHDSVIGRDRDDVTVDIGIPFKLVLHCMDQLIVSHQMFLSFACPQALRAADPQEEG